MRSLLFVHIHIFFQSKQMSSEEEQENPQCEECQSTEASSYCMICCCFLCKSCDGKIHSNSRVLERHKRVPVDEMPKISCPIEEVHSRAGSAVPEDTAITEKRHKVNSVTAELIKKLDTVIDLLEAKPEQNNQKSAVKDNGNVPTDLEVASFSWQKDGKVIVNLTWACNQNVAEKHDGDSLSIDYNEKDEESDDEEYDEEQKEEEGFLKSNKAMYKIEFVVQIRAQAFFIMKQKICRFVYQTFHQKLSTDSVSKQNRTMAPGLNGVRLFLGEHRCFRQCKTFLLQVLKLVFLSLRGPPYMERFCTG